MTEQEQAAYAEKRSGGVVSRQMLWKQALGTLDSLGLPEARTQRLLAMAEYPDELQAAARLLARENAWETDTKSPAETALEDWYRRMDDTGGADIHWLRAISAVHEFAEKNGLEPNLRTVLGFVSCCEEAAGMGYGYGGLEDVTIQMLEHYGFEG